MTQIAIVVYPGYTALDFIGPYEVLRNLPDAEVRFLWHEPGPIAADSGVLLVGATHSFEETPSPDVILIPGGMTTMEHARDEKLLDWVRQAHQTATWTASVCSGSVILAAAGLLEGKRATSHWLVLTALKALGATPVSDERIEWKGDQKNRHQRGLVGGHRPGDGWPANCRPGPRQDHPAGHRIRPAAAVLLRPHVQGLHRDQGGGHGVAEQGHDQAHTAQGHDGTEGWRAPSAPRQPPPSPSDFGALTRAGRRFARRNRRADDGV